MGVFTPIPGCCKVECVGHDNFDGRPIVNVLHASCGTSPTLAQLTAIGAAVSSTFSSHAGAFPDTYTFDNVVVTDLNSSSGPQAVVLVALAGSGGDAVPAECGVVELYSSLRGRSYRGRVYIPIANNVTFVDGGGTTTGWQTAILSYFTALQAAIVAVSAGFSLVIASRKLGTWEAVQSVAARVLLGWIRRRLFG
jgi:hypothetical protein